MTGRDLIIYILENKLEDELVFQDGKFIGFITVEEAAAKIDVGTATIKAMVDLNIIKGVYVNTALYVPFDFNKNRE